MSQTESTNKAAEIFEKLATPDRIGRTIGYAAKRMIGLPVSVVTADDIAGQAWTKLYRRLVRCPYEYILRYGNEDEAVRDDRLFSYVLRYVRDELSDAIRSAKCRLPSVSQHPGPERPALESNVPEGSDSYPWVGAGVEAVNLENELIEAVLHRASVLPETERRVVDIIISILPDEPSRSEIRAEYQRRYNETLTPSQLQYSLGQIRRGRANELRNILYRK